MFNSIVKRFILLVMLLVLLAGYSAAQAAMPAFGLLLVVNTDDDVNDGVCDNAHCSLREAIATSNGVATADTIHFDIPGPGVHTITPLAPLPPIIDTVTIDGTSEPGADCNSWPPQLQIELDGAGAGAASGLQIQADDVTVRGLVINRFLEHGIEVVNSDGSNLTCNFIGTEATGAAAQGNGMSGLFLLNSNSAQVGGTSLTDHNLVAGNGRWGIRLGPGSSSNNIVANYIGTDVHGAVAVANQLGGISLQAPGNTIGSNASLQPANVISGNGGPGIYLSPAAANTSVVANYVGTNSDGNAAIPNQSSGLVLDNVLGTSVGGPSPHLGNLISGNRQHGIHLSGANTTITFIQNNYIGTDAAAQTRLGNRQNGILVENARTNQIGGPPGFGNVIAGNRRNGVELVGAQAVNNTIQGNGIGINSADQIPLRNGRSGIRIQDASLTLVGGLNAHLGNVIAFNRRAGVEVRSGIGNGILSNRIFRNGSLGIDLNNDGVTPNDPGDPDFGANRLQNYPELHNVLVTPVDTTFEGVLNSMPNTNYRLEFYNGPCDGSGFGEGQRYLGSANVVTNGAGVAVFMVVLPVSANANASFTVTATDPQQNTSEFSACWGP